MIIDKKIIKILVASVITILMLSTLSATAVNIDNEKTEVDKKIISANNNLPYEGRLIVYIVEPVSRWDTYDGDPFHYAFLDNAYDGNISIDYQDTYEDTIIWDGIVLRNNVIVIAGVFNEISEQKYSDPPHNNYPFNAHYLDAAAGATPGNIGYNTVTDDFTHTVLVEVGSKTTCPYCPATNNALYNIYQSGDYPFYFIEFVYNKNLKAMPRMFFRETGYNLIRAPASFFDGGYEVLIGGHTSESMYRTRIENCGSREVHKLDLSLSVGWEVGGTLVIDITIENNDQIYHPKKPDKPSGTNYVKINETYEYFTSTFDPNGDQIFYKWNWGDGSESGWVGPYDSGDVAYANHTWFEDGTYYIKVKAKDIEDHVSQWSDELGITLTKSKSKTTRSTLLRFLENYPHLFPILRYLLEL
jgi:hypothetical protein